jgi:hypothetical protein
MPPMNVPSRTPIDTAEDPITSSRLEPDHSNQCRAAAANEQQQQRREQTLRSHEATLAICM